MSKQEFKVTNLNTGCSVFFFQHSLKSAHNHMENYIERNKGAFPMEVFFVNEKPIPAKRWIFYKKIEINFL